MIFDSLSAVSSVLASSSTSPVLVSITSAATNAPSRSLSVDFDLGDLGLLDFLHHRRRDLAAGVRDLFAALGLMLCASFRPSRLVGRSMPGSSVQNSFLSFSADAVDGVERAQNVFVGTQAQGAQENRAQELALAIDADVEDVLLVVLKLDPRSAVRNDLAEEVGAVVGGLEEHAGRTVQLADDHALGAVDDERAVLRSSAECRRRRLPAP